MSKEHTADPTYKPCSNKQYKVEFIYRKSTLMIKKKFKHIWLH